MSGNFLDVSNCPSYPFIPIPFHNQVPGPPRPYCAEKYNRHISIIYFPYNVTCLPGLSVFCISCTVFLINLSPQPIWVGLDCVLTIDYNILRDGYIEIPCLEPTSSSSHKAKLLTRWPLHATFTHILCIIRKSWSNSETSVNGNRLNSTCKLSKYFSANSQMSGLKFMGSLPGSASRCCCHSFGKKLLEFSFGVCDCQYRYKYRGKLPVNSDCQCNLNWMGGGRWKMVPCIPHPHISTHLPLG